MYFFYYENKKFTFLVSTYQRLHHSGQNAPFLAMTNHTLVIASTTKWCEAISESQFSCSPVPSLRGPRKWPVAICGPSRFCHCETPLFPLSLRGSVCEPKQSLFCVFQCALGTGDCRVRAKYALPRNDKPHPCHCEPRKEAWQSLFCAPPIHLGHGDCQVAQNAGSSQ